jgi:ribosomal protein S18 acetylase RimI-like enzyme
MFTIKKATLADIEVIRTLAAQTFPATYQHILTPEQIDYMMDWMYSSESLRNQMEKEHHIYYIAYEECEPAGYVSIQQEDTDLFHLQKIYVLPYFQKYKLGRQLFQQAIKGIKELHPEPCRMELNVNRQNPALGFYEHMGMKKVREGDFPIGNGYYMNDYIMGCWSTCPCRFSFLCFASCRSNPPSAKQRDENGGGEP